MATAAFRSNSKRTSIGNDGAHDSRASSRSSTASSRPRARSVSRFSHRLPSESADFTDQTTTRTTPAVETRGKFVNKARGTAFPEISLDDLAIELFASSERGRTTQVSTETAPSHRRGRSVSRQASSRLAGERESVVSTRSNGGGSAVTAGKVVSDRRRRSLSVVRYRASDSESDNSEKYSGQINFKSISSVNKQAAVHKQATPSQQRGLQRSSSQRDFLKSSNGYSSYSSVLTDDETQDVQYSNDGFESFRPISARKKSDFHSDLGEVKRKELRHTVDEIKVRDSEDFSKRVNGGGLQQKHLDVSRVRIYSTKLEQSEKRKQELRAQIMLEEQHHKDLKRVVGEWLPHAKESVSRRPSRTRKRSNDRKRIPNILNEEADKIIEDFISSVEDNTDISSFDGDRSDTSSSFGAAVRPKDFLMHFGEPENYNRTPIRMAASMPAEMDGVVLPWLQWETTESPLLSKDKKQTPATPKTVLQETIEEITSNANKTEQSTESISSRGSWSPAVAESFSVDSETSKTTKPTETRKSRLLTNVPRRSRVDIDEYLTTRSNDEILFERLKLGARISSGGILLCETSRGPILL